MPSDKSSPQPPRCPASCAGRRAQRFLLALGAFVAVLSAYGCVTVAVDEEPVRSTPLRPVWSGLEVRRHLSFFNNNAVAGRATGTRAYVLASAYVAARMREFGLQPALGSEFRTLYPTRVNFPKAFRLTASGRLDTLLFIPGVDALPDGRTDGGRLEGDRVIIRPDSAQRLSDLIVLWPAGEATTEALMGLRRQGARAVLTVGPLTPRRVAAPVTGLVVLQVTEQALGRLLGVDEAAARRILTEMRNRVRRLPRTIELDVEVEALPELQGINLLGYVPGKVPPHLSELVIVCADLDAVGDFGGARVIDRAHPGAGAAALLELARQYSVFADYLTIPDRTILFAVWSGARTGQAGLRAYLEEPGWVRENIRSVIYVGPDAADTTGLRALVEPHGWRFHAVLPPDSLAPVPEPILLPEAPWMKVLRDLRPDDVPPVPDLDEERARDEQAALALADRAHRLILRETVVPAPPVLFIGDSLYVPRVTNE